jgi:predicted nucleotidyltransferase
MTDTISPDIRAEILRRLAAAELEHDVRVLLAVESGSRAWGFASPDSDYDARFIYVHRRDWYLAVGLEEQRDVIEYPIVDELDVNGWDLRKALRLFWKSNPAFVEWIQSPIVYVAHGRFAAVARALLPQVYSCERGIYHYRSMAKTNHRGYLRGETVPLKKYFYVLRPLLSVRWLERNGQAAPIEFRQLLGMIDDAALLADIDDLLARKRAAPELGRGSPIPRINAFIESELERLEHLVPPAWRPAGVVAGLDAAFRELLGEAW